jgi:ferredoxin
VSDERWQISVDHGVCVGTAMCAGSYPNLFTMNNGYSEPVNPEVEPNDDVIDAADSCPMEAIRVTDAGGKVLAPSD